MNFDPVSLALVLALLTLMPLMVVVSTSFLKIAMVILIVRNALGIQQVPPNIAVYGLALTLTFYVMAPVTHQAYQAITANPAAMQKLPTLITTLKNSSEPFRAFLLKHSRPKQRDFFEQRTKALWPADMQKDVTPQDFAILMPAFVVSELTSGFEMGFLLYLPFIVIDLVVSNILLALGMMMVSPMTISLPLKLLLFVIADGWTRMIHGLIMSYA